MAHIKNPLKLQKAGKKKKNRTSLEGIVITGLLAEGANVS